MEVSVFGKLFVFVHEDLCSADVRVEGISEGVI